MSPFALFVLQASVYAVAPFYMMTLGKSVRTVAFYVYLGVILALGGFLGSLYSLPITGAAIVPGGSLAYGAFLMTTVLFMIVENKLSILKNVVRLVLTLNAFLFLLYNLLALALGNPAAANPFGVSSQVFHVSLKVMLVGEALIIGELFLMMAVFELLKKRIKNGFLLPILYAAIYVAVLCLDGILFPALAFGVNSSLARNVFGSLPGKFVMAVAYGTTALAFLTIFRKSLQQYLRSPLSFRELANAPRAMLIDEIERQRVSIRDSEEKYRHLAESVKDIFFSMDSELRYTYWNKASEATGFSSEQALGKNLYEMFPQIKGSAVGKFYTEVMETGREAHMVTEVRLFGGSGYYELFAYPFNGGVSVIARDITDRIRSEQELAAHRDQLESLVRQRTESLQSLNDELIAAKAEAETLATHDFLTGLPNRVLMEDRLTQAIALVKRRGSLAAVMTLDLDGFKKANDTYGHGAGDILLVEIASRLKASTREFDTVIRLGGDEFLILSPEVASREQAEKMADRLLDALRQNVRLPAGDVSLTGSLGISLYPEHGTDPNELIANSDRALYAAKRMGKDRYAFFESFGKT